MTNPLSTYFRQPAVYVRLPSQGRWYPPGCIELNDQGEVGIMPMTAKDEMTIRTPDALMNGQATVDVFKSCIPAIKDPWHVPSMDTDTLLVGIRIATYGEMMDVTTAVPNTQESNTVQVHLSTMLERISYEPWGDVMQLSNGLVVNLKPMNYRGISQQNLKSYEEQRLIRTVQDSTMTEQQKLEEFNKIFAKIGELSVKAITDMIVSIKMPDQDEAVIDPVFIKEWVHNIETKYANEIRNHIDREKNKGTIPPVDIVTPAELIEKGAPKSYQTQISMDNSNFFVPKSSRSRNLTS